MQWKTVAMFAVIVIVVGALYDLVVQMPPVAGPETGAKNGPIEDHTSGWFDADYDPANPMVFVRTWAQGQAFEGRICRDDDADPDATLIIIVKARDIRATAEKYRRDSVYAAALCETLFAVAKLYENGGTK
jgi:hypothetical protein